MLKNVLASIEIRKKTQSHIEFCKEYTGKLIMANIIHGTVRSENTRSIVDELTKKFQGSPDTPLFEITEGEKVYEGRIMMHKNLVSGEYFTIRDFESKFGLPEDFEKIFDIANFFILDNAIKLFGKLTKTEKHTYPVFKRIIHSRKVRGLYHYEEHGSESFGIYITEKS